MITKMHLVNITGPRDDIDRLADEYLSHFDIHLLNTSKELSEIKTLKQYTSPNPYEPWLERVNSLLEFTNAQPSQDKSKHLSFNELKEKILKTEEAFAPQREALENLETKYKESSDLLTYYEPFRSIEKPLDELLALKHIKIRFGRFTVNNYRKFKKYIDDMVPSIFIKAKETDEYVYGLYFTTFEARQRVDALYYSLAFERMRIPEDTGTFKEIIDKYEKTLKRLQSKIDDTKGALRQVIQPKKDELIAAKDRLLALSKAYGVRKFAAITRDEFAQKETRYLLLGWMPQDQAETLAQKLKAEPSIALFIEDESDSSALNPPTKMKNRFFVKPFELITRMYGIPNYHEIDPTGLVALSYSLLFGAMFGDIGHGLLLLLLGLVGYAKKNWELLRLFVPIGLSSMVFGFLYGALFGFEDILEPVWLTPMSNLSTIPFFGQLNTVFITSVLFGMFLILMTMLMNIGIRYKHGETLEVIFDKNGVCGFLFYGLVVVLLVLYMTGHTIPVVSVLLTILLLLLLCIAFKEQIISHLEKNHTEKQKEKDSLAIMLLATFFETFEIILTYFSNTISFVRVGAFAISHGAMMSVVLMFANAEGSLNHVNWLIFILGNLFVVGFEGLIVFIQVLRLEFYEIFSHFYKGDGIEFKSFGH